MICYVFSSNLISLAILLACLTNNICNKTPKRIIIKSTVLSGFTITLNSAGKTNTNNANTLNLLHFDSIVDLVLHFKHVITFASF